MVRESAREELFIELDAYALDSDDEPVPKWRGTHDMEASDSGKGMESVFDISSNED